MARVAGIGIGLFILTFIWVVSLFMCIAFSRAQGGIANAGIGTVFLAIVVTLVLWFFPRGDDTGIEDYAIYDDYYNGRTALVSMAGIVLAVGLFFVLINHYFEPQKAIVLKKLRA